MEITAVAWGTGLDDAVPSHFLKAMTSNKGTVLMAWDDARPIGFCFSILSFEGHDINDPNFRLSHYSHQAGILPEYAGQRVGEKLKWAQRDAVLKQGVSLITWTFDPLQTLNANLNLHKLGAVCHEYKRNYYGKMDDDHNRGLPTDRFRVRWWIDSPWVQRHADGSYRSPTLDALRVQGVTFLNEVALKNGRLHPTQQRFMNWSEHLLLTIPKNFHQIHQDDLPLALAWRHHTRELFEAAFERGYTAVDLLVEPDRCHYLLDKKR